MATSSQKKAGFVFTAALLGGLYYGETEGYWSSSHIRDQEKEAIRLGELACGVIHPLDPQSPPGELANVVRNCGDDEWCIEDYPLQVGDNTEAKLYAVCLRNSLAVVSENEITAKVRIAMYGRHVANINGGIVEPIITTALSKLTEEPLDPVIFNDAMTTNTESCNQEYTAPLQAVAQQEVGEISWREVSVVVGIDTSYNGCTKAPVSRGNTTNADRDCLC